MRFMMLMIPKGYENAAPGRHAGRQGRRRDDEVQRITAEGRRAAGARWPAPALDGRACLVPRRQAQGDRRTLHRGEGSAWRLLDDSGEVEGGGHRMGVALPRRRRTKSSRFARCRSSRTFRPMFRMPRPGFPSCSPAGTKTLDGGSFNYVRRAPASRTCRWGNLRPSAAEPGSGRCSPAPRMSTVPASDDSLRRTGTILRLSRAPVSQSVFRNLHNCIRR